MKILIGNLSKMTTARHLADLFLPFGQVFNAKIIRDSTTGFSRGTGYIEMDARSGGIAIKKLNSIQFMNSYMEIIEAR